VAKDKLFKKALALSEARDFSAAIPCYLKVLARQPRHLDANYLLGAAYAERKQYTEAEQYLSVACRLRPDSPAILANLGNVYMLLDRLDPAVECFQRAVDVAPDFSFARNGLGLAYGRCGRYLEALEQYDQAITHAPRTAQYRSNAAILLSGVGLAREALARYTQALSIDPRNDVIHSNYLMTLNYLPEYTPEKLAELHFSWGRTHPCAPPRSAVAGDRVRIGYVSPDFRQHPVGQLIFPVLREHDRGRFAVHCYADSTETNEDDLTHLMRALDVEWTRVAGMSVPELAATIRRDRIDVLVDLAGHTAGNRLPLYAARPAQVNVSYLGYPATTGLQCMDGMITDAWLDPHGRADGCYSEALIRLTEGWFVYEPLAEVPPVGPLPCCARNFVTFGALCNSNKLNDDVIGAWSRILASVDRSRLVMQSKYFRDPQVVALFQQRFAGCGVALERLDFLPQMPYLEHLAIYSGIDVCLDTFPWNGHMTVLGALTMGVPVIAIEGNTRAGRMASGILHALGLSDLVTRDVDAYVAAATSLSRDPDRLQALRAGMRARLKASPMAQARHFTRGLEQAYLDLLAGGLGG